MAIIDWHKRTLKTMEAEEARLMQAIKEFIHPADIKKHLEKTPDQHMEELKKNQFDLVELQGDMLELRTTIRIMEK